MVNPYAIRPIGPDDLSHTNLKCMPESPAIRERLFARQGTLGMGAFDGDTCVASLHGHQLTFPEPSCADLPEWVNVDDPAMWPRGMSPISWPIYVARRMRLAYERPVWVHACVHVGLLPGKGENEPAYGRRGLGTALAEASVEFARTHGCAAVLTIAGPGGLVFDYNHWQGSLPHSTYSKLGFRTVAVEEDGLRLPFWATGKVPHLTGRVQAALAAGMAVSDICARVMVLEFQRVGPAGAREPAERL